MPVCKNTDRKYYTGKENTPLGKGYSASAEDEGTRKRGKDGKMYVARRVKGGKRWMPTRSSTSPKKRNNTKGLFKNPKETRGMDARALNSFMKIGAGTWDEWRTGIKTYPPNIENGKAEEYTLDLMSYKSRDRLKRMGKVAFQQQYDNNMIMLMNELIVDDQEIWNMDLGEYKLFNNLAMENSPGELEHKISLIREMLIHYDIEKYWDADKKLREAILESASMND